jgi:hypothetical protein
MLKYSLLRKWTLLPNVGSGAIGLYIIAAIIESISPSSPKIAPKRFRVRLFILIRKNIRG